MKSLTGFSNFANRCQKWVTSRFASRQTSSDNLYRLKVFHPFLLGATVRFTVLSGKVTYIQESERHKIYGTRYWVDSRITQIQKLWIQPKHGPEICREFRDFNMSLRPGDTVSLVRGFNSRKSNGAAVLLYNHKQWTANYGRTRWGQLEYSNCRVLITSVVVYKLLQIVLTPYYNAPMPMPPLPGFFQGLLLLALLFGPWLAVILTWLTFSRRIQQKIRDRACEIAHYDAATL